MPDDLERVWITQIAQLEAERHMQYISTAERFAMQKGHDEGFKEGREEGREVTIRLLLRLLTHQFGAVPLPIQERVQALTLDQAEALVNALLTSNSLAEFAAQLPPIAATPPCA